MGYFPFFVDIDHKLGLIVGGGVVALRKIQKLQPYGASLTVVAPNILPEIQALPNVRCIFREFVTSDIQNCFFVIAATDDIEENHQIAKLCNERSILVNVVDDKSYCSFLFPCLVKQGDCSIGISTGGASPSAAIYLKNQIRALLPDNFDEILNYLAQERNAARSISTDESVRSRILRELFELSLSKGRPLTAEESDSTIRSFKNSLEKSI